MTAATDTLFADDGVSGVSAHATAEMPDGRLDVITGIQQGASVALQQQVELSLGSSLENDIVLRDTDVLSEHLGIRIDAEVIKIQSLSGEVLVDGLALPVGESTMADNSVIVQIGSVALSINSQVKSGIRSPEMQSQSSESLGAADYAEPEMPGINDSILNPNIDDLPGPLLGEQKPEQIIDKKSGFKSGVLTLSAMCLGAVVVWQSGLFAPEKEQPVALSGLIAASSFAGLTVSQTGNAATVTGFVDTFQESSMLNSWLDQTGLQINNEVLVGEALSDQVIDLFRVNGIIAKVEVADGGVVTAVTEESDIALLDTVEQRVMSDIPKVKELRIDNTPPPVVDDPIMSKPDPGKRVAMVVSDDVAYVVTEDQSRYFVGSLLPSGHRITQIKDGTVSLEKNGVETTLEF